MSKYPNFDSVVYMAGRDRKYHICDGNGGTLCGERFAQDDPWLDETCAKCEGIADELTAATSGPTRPTIVCLCGSTRFSDAFQKANLLETLAGNIVLTIGCDMRSDTFIFHDLSEDQRAEIKAQLDQLHLRKIDLADEVLILNVGDYIGESTRRELAYANEHGKKVRFLESHYEKPGDGRE